MIILTHRSKGADDCAGHGELRQHLPQLQTKLGTFYVYQPIVVELCDQL